MKNLFSLALTALLFSCGTSQSSQLATDNEASRKYSTHLFKENHEWTYAVLGSLNAPVDSVWENLTNVEDFPVWNSTIATMEGSIEYGGTINLTVPHNPQTFTVKVTTFMPKQMMIWRDEKGSRTFMIGRKANGKTLFYMAESI